MHESWRSRWVIGDDADSGQPDAVHDSGLAFDFIYRPEGAAGRWRWCPVLNTTAASHKRETLEMDEADYSALLDELEEQALALWLALGYSHDSMVKTPTS